MRIGKTDMAESQGRQAWCGYWWSTAPCGQGGQYSSGMNSIHHRDEPVVSTALVDWEAAGSGAGGASSLGL